MTPKPIFEGGDLHVGSHHGGPGRLEAECPCPKAPCGLVATANVAEECPHHSPKAAKTLRTMHWEFDCPGGAS